MAATVFYGNAAPAFARIHRDRDIVLVDQRGTGRSSPLLCAAFKPDHSLKAALEFDPLPKATSCAQELAANGVDAAQYTTAAWVADLDAVRIALGYDKINLWGGSYGTRVAQEYLRRYPQRVRSVVLDGVATPAMRSTLDVWPSREVALGAIVEACAQSRACAAAHPDLKTTIDGIRSSLGPEGRDVTLIDPRTGDSQSMRLTFEHVIGALQSFTYVPELAALLPEVIARAASGDFGPLYAGAMLVTGDLDEQSNTALHYSVTCAEDVPRVTAADAASALASLRTKTLAERALSVCTAWPKGIVPADATTRVKSDVPVLILSGGLDPVTPPANGADVAKSLPDSRHIVAQGYGHIVSPHACGPRLIAAFLDDPTFESLPASCVEHFEKSRRPPLWPDRLGARS